MGLSHFPLPMMMLFYARYCVLLLWSLYTICHSAIDDDTVARAKKGAWVALRDSDDEAIIKVAKMSEFGRTVDAAEDFCKQDDSHLTSVLSENEMKFIGDLVVAIYRSGGGNYEYVHALTGLRRGVIWSDGSATDFVVEAHKDPKAVFEGTILDDKKNYCTYVSFLFDDYLIP
ncbi:hypothetical protein OSTOST_03644 [Ostertagia ostertagi]